MSGRAKRRTEDVGETCTRSRRTTDCLSEVNWHFPGGTRAETGGPCREEGKRVEEVEVEVVLVDTDDPFSKVALHSLARRTVGAARCTDLR